MELGITHKPLLFKTTVFNDDSYGFTNYGIYINNGQLSLAYIDRFYRKSSTAKVYHCDEIFHSSRQQMPSSVEVPVAVWNDAEAFFKGMVINGIGN